MRLVSEFLFFSALAEEEIANCESCSAFEIKTIALWFHALGQRVVRGE